MKIVSRYAALVMAFAATLGAIGCAATPASDEASKLAVPDLVGVFSTGRWIVTLTSQGYMVEVDPETGAVNALIQFSAEDGVFRLRDISPPDWVDGEVYECVTNNWGEYDYMVDGDAVTTRLGRDPCSPRAMAFDGLTMTRIR